MILQARTYAVSLCSLIFLLALSCFAQAAEPLAGARGSSPSYNISAITMEQTEDDFLLRVRGESPPTYTMYELFDPLRVVLDIADARLADSMELPQGLPLGPIAEVKPQVLDDPKSSIARVEIILTEDRGYAVERQGNDIVIMFAKDATAAPSKSAEHPSPMQETATEERAASDISVETTSQENRTDASSAASSLITDIMQQEDKKQLAEPSSEVVAQILVGQELIQPVIPKNKPATKPAEKEKAASSKKEEKPKEASASKSDNFAFAGYQKQKISVDFYKIDLHNVFRLFGEISGLNIVVDEGVSGSLTLALNDVPWDFALDIILNLKDLQKEERFNTLVISPKSKEFTWPKSMTENIAFKADGSAEKLEALSVTERLKSPKEVVEAKKLLRQAHAFDAKGNYSDALPLYEEAFGKWPDNSKLASRIANICLVHLGMNAKAVHYAKAALKADPQNYNAALQAAIGLANMQKVAESKEYFDLAISGPQPASEALASYAAFCEQYESYNAAILLLSKQEELYGATLDAMIAKARIYDKKGEANKAVAEYRVILLSGYELPNDLKQYIQGRIALTAKN